MPVFIKLTMYNGEPLYLSVDKIVSFYEYSGIECGIRTAINTVETEDQTLVQEDFETVARMVGAC